MGYRLVATLPVLVGAAALMVACQKEEQGPPPEDLCAQGQAISQMALGGASMPAKTLALTFDDGPGDRTIELSNYLKAQGIRATFFVNGVRVPGRQNALTTLVADGHLLANHTQNHRNLTTLNAQTVVSEVLETDTILAPLVPGGKHFLFRPPYGAYNAATFAALDGSAMKKYVGPIMWEIGDALTATSAADWDCWDAPNGTRTTQQCGNLYIQEAEAKGKGIVLLHDPFGGPTGNTVDMVKYMVPILKTKGFSFVRVDEVPDIAALLPPLPVADAGADGATPDAGSGDDAAAPDAASGSSSSSSSGTATPPRPDPCAPQPAATQVTGESGYLLR